jgi:hypothetical protein
MKKNNLLIIGLIALVVVIGGGAYFYFQANPLLTGQPEIPPTEIPEFTPTPTISPIPTKIVPDDWEIYTSQQNDFQIAHPSNMEITTNPNEGVRLILSGPSQSQGTEITDGILLIISTGGYNENSFQEFVQSQANKQATDPLTESVSEVGDINVSDLNGYSFDTVGLGESTYYYLNRGENQYLRVIEIVQDPTGQGFEQTVNQMLSTLTLI